MPVLSLTDPASKKGGTSPAGLLESSSLLPAGEGEAYVRLYPTAGEACVVQVPYWLQARPECVPRPAGASSPRQRQANARRACAAVRRSCRANAGRFLWTLTYAEEPADRATIVKHLRRFYEAAQGVYGRLWLLAVIEEGAELGRFHVHFAAGRFLGLEVIRRLWGRGHVFVGDPRKLPGKVSPRKLAGYLAKYTAKSIPDDCASEEEARGELPAERRRAGGEHRYYVTQGWAPACVKFQAWDLQRALGWLHQVYGSPDFTVAWSDETLSGVCGVFNSYPDRAIARWRKIAAGAT